MRSLLVLVVVVLAVSFASAQEFDWDELLQGCEGYEGNKKRECEGTKSRMIPTIEKKPENTRGKRHVSCNLYTSVWTIAAGGWCQQSTPQSIYFYRCHGYCEATYYSFMWWTARDKCECCKPVNRQPTWQVYRCRNYVYYLPSFTFEGCRCTSVTC